MISLKKIIRSFDDGLYHLGEFAFGLCNICLLCMLVLTSATFLLRPLDISVWWIWPWTMVLFVWLSFFGFFAIYVQQKDIRIDFLINRLPYPARIISRVLANVVALGVTFILVQQMPNVIASARGYVEGALLLSFGEIPRRALFLPLFLSSFLVTLTALVDLAKIIVGLPEREATIHPEVSP